MGLGNEWMFCEFPRCKGALVVFKEKEKSLMVNRSHSRWPFVLQLVLVDVGRERKGK